MKEIALYLRELMEHFGLDQRDLALQAGMAYQNVSAVLNGSRNLTPWQSVKLDDIFGLKIGTIYQKQAYEEAENCSWIIATLPSYYKRNILDRVKENGGLWSYDGIPASLSDDDIIEEGLRHLDLEDLHLLFELWSPSHIKRIWRQRLVTEGERSNILNTILGIVCFGMGYEQTKRYLLNYGCR